MKKNKKIFLFSIDLEDAREEVLNGHLYKDSVVSNTLLYLQWLRSNSFKCTFFVVGTIAARYPDLIKEIIAQGHEIACHSYNHTTLNKHSPESFKKDIEQNINELLKAGATSVKGFRAPVFSLTQKTSWAHQILFDAGIVYSSSVLPAKNPLFGWQEFGPEPKKINNGLLEIPMSTNRFGPLTIPFAGGVYFRCLPFMFIKRSFAKKFENNLPVLSYFHPYDIDFNQERYMHAGINNSSFYNFLMYYNRKNMLKRLDKILTMDVDITTYEEYSKIILNNGV